MIHRMRRRGWLGSLLIAASLALAACVADGGAGARQFMSIGTGGTGGVYYPLGGALASRLSLADSARQYTAEVTGGSVENVHRVADGEMDLGFSMAITMYEAYNGGPDHPEPIEALRAAAPLYPNFLHMMVGENSTISSAADLRGRRVSVGSPGSGTEQTSRQLLEAHGITYDDVRVRYLSFRESSDALRDGAIDAAIIAAGYPTSAVLEAITSGNAKLVPLTGPSVDEMVARFPYYGTGRIPAGAYPGVTEEVPTVVVMNWIVAQTTTDSAVVHRLLDALHDDRDALVRVHDIARQIDLDALFDPPIPLHPAAQRWRDEHLPPSGS